MARKSVSVAHQREGRERGIPAARCPGAFALDQGSSMRREERARSGCRRVGPRDPELIAFMHQTTPPSRARQAHSRVTPHSNLTRG